MRKYYLLLSALFVSIGISIYIPSSAHSYPSQNGNQDYKQLQGKQYKNVSSSTILASVNGQNLTQGMFDNTRAYGEFLAGKKFTPSEVSWLKKLVIKEFSKATVSEIQSYNNKLTKLLSDIRQLNPILQAKFREHVLAEMYLKLLAENKLNEPSMMTLVYKHSPVIAADPNNKVVVTKRALQSYIKLHNFTEQLLGRPLLSNQAIKEVLPEFQKQFHEFPLENKITIAKGESNWLNLQQVWLNYSPSIKLQKVTQLRDIVKDPKLSPTLTLLNITLKSQVSSGWQNDIILLVPPPIPTSDIFPAPIRFGN